LLADSSFAWWLGCHDYSKRRLNHRCHQWSSKRKINKLKILIFVLLALSHF
jgi:hypothetical protein